MKRTGLMIGICLAVYAGGHAQISGKTDIEQEKLSIHEIIQHTIGWAKEKDTVLLYGIIADDKNYLEVHPGGKVVKGIEQFREAEKIWLDPRFKHISFKTSEMHVNLSQDGNVAWFFCVLDDINEWDGSTASWENTRWT